MSRTDVGQISERKEMNKKINGSRSKSTWKYKTQSSAIYNNESHDLGTVIIFRLLGLGLGFGLGLGLE